MSNPRPIQSARIRIGTPRDKTAYAAMRTASRVNASLFSDNPEDLENWYLVQSRTELNPLEVLYTLKSCDAPPQVAPEPALEISATPVTADGRFSVRVPKNIAPTAEDAARIVGVTAAPAEPTIADLMREIQVLQRMVASMAQCAHGAPLVVRHGE